MLPGSNSTSLNPCVALGFALDFEQPDTVPTLFIITCQNYKRVQGILMDNPALSAYPTEAELLLTEGAKVLITAVDQNVKINSKYGRMA